MLSRRTRALRSVLALVLFSTSGGAEQLADAILFHGRVTAAEPVRVNSGDHCHAEQCDLGVPIATPPPVEPRLADGRFALPIGDAPAAWIDRVARALPTPRAHSPRAPPRLA